MMGSRFLSSRCGGWIVLIAVVLADCASAPAQSLPESAQMIDSLSELPVGLGALPEPRVPEDNLQSPEKVELGRRLFSDKRLSMDNTISCSGCHNPRKGFSDGRVRAIGFHGTTLPRHTPSLWNTAYNLSQFWDGRAIRLEDQASAPLSSPTEMNSPIGKILSARLDEDPYYHRSFRKVFGDAPNVTDITRALAAYERTLIARNSRFDRYARGDKNALSLQEKNGLVLFIGKGRCARCHNGPNFSDGKFQNIGEGTEDDQGRFSITHEEADRGAFKTPGLRNVTLHPPYMHDGNLPTLEAVIDYYDRGGGTRAGKSPFIMKIGLTADEKRNLIAFLRSLTDESRSMH